MSQERMNPVRVNHEEVGWALDEDSLAHHLATIRKQENDIGFMSEVFEDEDRSYKSVEDMFASEALEQIIAAQQKIRALQEEIAQQEAIIFRSEKTFKKYRQLHQDKSARRGRPVRSEYGEAIARKFTSQWVASLKEALDAKSCAKLETLVCSSSERNWRRWLKGDAIPSYATVEKLLGERVARGKYVGEPLFHVPSTPDHNALLALLRLI